MEQFIGYLVKNLVDEPDAVEVSLEEGDALVTAKVKVADSDMAKVIGRGGKTIHALRTISGTAAARLGHRIRIELVE